MMQVVVIDRWWSGCGNVGTGGRVVVREAVDWKL